MTAQQAEHLSRVIARTPSKELEEEIEFIYAERLDYEESDVIAMIETELATRSGYMAMV